MLRRLLPLFCASLLFMASTALAAGPRTHLPGDLTMQEALTVQNAALEKARAQGVPMNIAVVDAGGHLKTFVRQDGAFLGSIDVSIKKAVTQTLTLTVPNFESPYLSNLNPLTSSSYSTATKEPGLKRKSSTINLSLSMTSSTNSVPTSILLNDRMPSLKTDLLSRRLNMSEIPKKNRYNLINSDQVSAKRRRANYMRLYQNRLIQSTFNSKKSSEEPALLKSILQKIKKLKQPHEKPLVYTDECHENSNNNQILMKGNRENMFNMVVQDSQVWSSHQLPIYSRSI